ncbi:MAG TPA: PDZ domain-containing protein [Gammaproteobacteria bacterium]|nr:PDZ domain-containing protein [Gammaproteobacteria bacterium]
MLKTIAIVIAGLAAGFALATWWPRSEPVSELPSAAGGEWPDRLTELERRVQELSDELDELRGDPAVQGSSTRGEPRTEPAEGESAAEPPAARRAFPAGARFADRGPEAQLEQLVNAGFTPARAEWLSRRATELQMQALQALYDARREGKPLDSSTVPDEQMLLRSEIGDDEYEQYLRALGRPTSVGVRNVLASSPAESAGLQPGDEIVAYAGTRVFDMRDLNRLTFEGKPDEPVVVDVLRDGQRLQLVLPRGPVGVTAGRFGGRP